MTQSLLDAERARRPGASDDACVVSVAARVLRQLEVAEPPVDLDMLTSFLGIDSVTEDKHLREAGYLLPLGGRLQVRVRATDSPVRQRFTICHECGHTFFPGFERASQFRCSPDDGARAPTLSVPRQRLRVDAALERLCDLAASELLLPRHIYDDEARQYAFDLQSIKVLAARYNASLVATARRFVSAQAEPAAFVVFEMRQKPTQYGTDAAAALRVTSRYMQGAWPFLPRHKSVSRHSPIGRALSGEVVHEVVTLTDVFAESVRVLVSAELSSYRAAGEARTRVLTLLRRA